MKGIANKVAIVTGGASGIGRALCEELARRRAVVIVADLDGEEAGRVANNLALAGANASAAQVDVAVPDSVQKLVDETKAKHGSVDLMFNNAGVGWTGDFNAMSLPHADRVVSINLNGVLYGTRAAYPVMVQQGSGHIINTSSFFSGLIPVPGKSVYSATKHAIVGFSLSLREEARSFGVKVSTVCPSFVSTNIDENSAMILGAAPAPSASSLGTRIGTRDVTTTARAILRGVSRNRAIIILPSFIRPFWWLYRLSPVLLSAMFRPVITRRLHREKTSGLATVLYAPARYLFRIVLRMRKNL